MNILKQTTFVLTALMLFSCNGNAQNDNEKALIGTWEIQGILMGDDGEGTLMPHRQANPDCELDHSVFVADNTAKEVKYNKSCEAKETTFDWKLEENLLTLTKGDRSINWLIHSIEDDKMTVGVQTRPDSENRMYVVYQKKE